MRPRGAAAARSRIERHHDAGAGQLARQKVGKRYGKVRNTLFTFLEHPEAPPANNGSERELRPTATYRKVTGGFRSNWGVDLFATVRSVVGTAARRGLDACQAIRAVLEGESIAQPG
jgi:transposase